MFIYSPETLPLALYKYVSPWIFPMLMKLTCVQLKHHFVISVYSKYTFSSGSIACRRTYLNKQHHKSNELSKVVQHHVLEKYQSRFSYMKKKKNTEHNYIHYFKKWKENGTTTILYRGGLPLKVSDPDKKVIIQRCNQESNWTFWPWQKPKTVHHPDNHPNSEAWWW